MADFYLAIIRQEIDAMRRMPTASLDVSLGGVVPGFTNASTVEPDDRRVDIRTNPPGPFATLPSVPPSMISPLTYGDDFIDVRRYSLANARRDLDILHGQGHLNRFYGHGLQPGRTIQPPMPPRTPPPSPPASWAGIAVNNAASWVFQRMVLEDLTVSVISYEGASYLSRDPWKRNTALDGRWLGDVVPPASTLKP